MNPGRFIRPLRSRGVRRIGLTLAVLATLLALFYAEENWRGARAWARVKADLEARGEPLKWEALLQSVPEEENFWAAPVVRGGIVGSTQDPYRFSPGAALAAGWHNESRFDLAAALQWLRDNSVEPLPAATEDVAADMLAALASAEPGLAAMREAVDRPRAEPLSDHIDKSEGRAGFMLDTVRFYSLRIHAFLAAGQRHEAYNELVGALKLSRKLCARPPSLMDLLIGLAVAAHPVALIRDTEGRLPWDSQDLENLETELSALDVINPFAGVLRSERAYILTLLDRSPGALAVFGLRMVAGNVGTRLFPANWKQLWMAVLADAIQQRINGIAKHGLREESGREIKTAWFPPQGFNSHDHSANPLRGMSSIMRHCLQTQVDINIARIAIGAARHRIAHGRPPALLEQLTPFFPAGIPDDPITGAPFEFSLAGDGSFKVTSRGWNATSPDDDIVWAIAPAADDAVTK
jgi:hypothetical protein